MSYADARGLATSVCFEDIYPDNPLIQQAVDSALLYHLPEKTDSPYMMNCDDFRTELLIDVSQEELFILGAL